MKGRGLTVIPLCKRAKAVLPARPTHRIPYRVQEMVVVLSKPSALLQLRTGKTASAPLTQVEMMAARRPLHSQPRDEPGDPEDSPKFPHPRGAGGGQTLPRTRWR